MAEESIILKVGIDENQIKRSEEAIVSARDSIISLREANAALAAEGKRNTVEFVRNETAIRDLNNTVTENQRILDANQKLTSKATGSIKELRANVSRLKQEYVNLSEAERNNVQVGGALQKELLAQTEALKDLEAEIGVTSRNVGNYTGSILEAADGTGLFSKAQQALASAQKIASAATNAGTIATKSFGSALIATGIGAFIVILGSLISYLTRTQEGMDKVAQVTDAVGTFVAVIFDEFSRLGGQLINSVIPTFKGLGEILAGIFTLDFDRATKGFEDVKKVVSEIDGINVLEVGKNAGVAAVQSAKLTKEMQNIVRAEKDLSLERAQSRQQIEDLKKASDDINLSTAERAAMAEKALKIELALESKAIELQKQRVTNIKAKNALSKSTDADTNKAIEAEIELANLQQESATLQTELQNKLNGLRKEGADKAKAESDKAAAEKKERDDKATAEEKERIDKEVEAAKEAQEKANKDFEEAIKARAKETELGVRESLNKVRDQFADGLIDFESYEKELAQVEFLALQVRKESVLGQLQLNKDNATIDAETRIEIETDLQDQLRDLDDETTDIKIANRVELEKKNKEVTDKEAADAKDLEAAKIEALQAVLEASLIIFGEQSTAGKAAASFLALIDTYVAANNALANIPAPFGAIVAAATVIKGLANVAKINSAPPPKFAEGGGIEISGPSHARGGVPVQLAGRTVAEVEGGEGLFVMKKNAFQSLKALSNYNQNFGGKSWLSGGQSYLADGGAIARTAAPQLDRGSLQDAQRSIQEGMNSLTVVAKISDINRVSGEVRKVEIQGDLR